MRLKQYINEDEKQGLSITFVDIDETLFYTFAKIKVMKDDKEVTSLSNAEFNDYKLKDGESFDFGEFKNAKLFFETSKPIDFMIKKISDIAHRADKKGSKVILLTARSDFDDKETFLNAFRKVGFPIDITYVERTGNRKGASIPILKKQVVLEYLESGLYRRARIFDDYIENCKFFLSIQNDIPQTIVNKIKKIYDLDDEMPTNKVITFQAYQVLEKGGIKEIK